MKQALMQSQTLHTFSTTTLTLGQWVPETTEKSDSSCNLNISLSIMSLGATDNKKVRLGIPSLQLP